MNRFRRGIRVGQTMGVHIGRGALCSCKLRFLAITLCMRHGWRCKTWPGKQSAEFTVTAFRRSARQNWQATQRNGKGLFSLCAGAGSALWTCFQNRGLRSSPRTGKWRKIVHGSRVERTPGRNLPGDD